MGKLSAALQLHDLALPLGNSDDVAIGGLVLGGGVAAVSRSFGLTCDSPGNLTGTLVPAKQAIELLNEWIAWARRCRLRRASQHPEGHSGHSRAQKTPRAAELRTPGPAKSTHGIGSRFARRGFLTFPWVLAKTALV